MRPIGPLLGPDERAVISVETMSCDVDDGPHGGGIEILSEDGHTAMLAPGPESCNLRWDGFMSWE